MGNLELYSRKLEQALLKESNGRIKANVAKDIAELYSMRLGLHRRRMVVIMHKDVSQIARHILFTLNQECFID